MKYTIIEALSVLSPGSEWSIRDTDYSSIQWMSPGYPPYLESLESKVLELNTAEPMRLLRLERDRRLSETDWMAVSDRIMTDDQKTYRQALRDLPDKITTSPKLNEIFELDVSSVDWPVLGNTATATN